MRDAMPLVASHTDLTATAEVLVTVGAVATTYGHAVTAVRLFGAEAALREVAGPRMYRGLQTDRERAIAAARDAVGEPAFAQAWAEGRAWSVTRAMAEAHAALVRLAPESASATSATLSLAMPSAAVAGLTPREAEVLRLVAAGQSTPEIAEALFVSSRTISTHLTNIYGKLDVANRAEAVAYAVRHGLA
jgi:DNA-binding CsgD family transcriptional regulator